MPENVGGAVYSLDLDKQGFDAGERAATQGFQRMRAAGDQVTKSAGGISGSLGGIGRTAVAVALGMGGLNIAVTGLNTALRGTIAAAAEDAASQARLRTAVQASGAAYADYADQIEAVIKLGQQRGFSDDQTRASLSILIAQTGSITEATKRYAIAQDLARLTSMDVVTASRLLGKITDENTSALTRYGINIKKGATETEALAEIQKVAAGQAQNYADTVAGQFDRTSDSIAEAGESFGRILLPATVEASQAIAEAAGDAEKLANKLEGVGRIGADLFPSLTTGAVAFGAALGALKIAEFAGGIAAGIRSARAELAVIQQVQAENAAVGTPGGVSLATSEGTILGGLGKSFKSPQAAIIGTTLAVVALDAATRHFTGGGIVDFLTGETAAHDRAAEAARRQGDAIADLQKLEQLNIGPEAAGRLEVAAIIERATDAQKRFNDEVERLRKIQEEQGPPTAVPSGTPVPGQAPGEPPSAINARDIFNDEVNKAAQNLRDTLAAGKININQFREAASNPIFGDRFKSDLESTDRLLDTIKADVGSVANTIRTARAEFDKGLKLATDSLNRPDPIVENLKVQLLLLEEEKRRLEDIGDVKGVEKIDAQIAALNNTIAETAAPAEIARQKAQAFGAALIDAAGGSTDAINTAKEASTAFGNVLDTLSRQEAIDIALKLPLDNMSKLQRFLDLVKANSSLGIDVAVRIATAVITQTPQQQFPGANTPFLGGGIGNLPGADVEQQKAVNNALADLARQESELEKKTNAASSAAGNAAGNFEKVDKAAGGAANQTEIWADGIIDLGEAMQEGLSASQVAALENMHDAEIASFSLADALFRQEVETEKAAMGSDSLQIALVQIATELIKSKRTAEEWNLDEVLKPKFEEVQSMIDQIFSKPTKEGLALELKKAQLERRALLLEQGGADASRVGRKDKQGHPIPASDADKQLKAVNDQIAIISREIDLRQKDFEIAKLQTELRDQSLQSDVDLLNANQFLGTALESLSGSVKDTEDALGVRLFDAGLRAASALNAVGAAGGTGFTAAEKHWINGVAAGAGEPPPFPGFKWGLDFVPRDNMPAMLHYGEGILTREQNQTYREGDKHFAFYMQGGMSEAETERLMVRKYREWVRSAKGAGAYSLPSSSVPRR